MPEKITSLSIDHYIHTLQLISSVTSIFWSLRGTGVYENTNGLFKYYCSLWNLDFFHF